MKPVPFARLGRPALAALCLIVAGGCSALRTSETPQPSYYSLAAARIEGGSAGGAAVTTAAPTLAVNPPHAAPGFDSRRIIYSRDEHKLEYFAHNEWVDTPARMLAPLLVAAIENSGAFHAVVLTPSAAAADLRLDTEIVRLQHNFRTPPSQVRFTLRATLVDGKTRRVLASREFNAAAPSASEDPYGGVIAANLAVRTVLEALSAFCADALRKLPDAR